MKGKTASKGILLGSIAILIIALCLVIWGIREINESKETDKLRKEFVEQMKILHKTKSTTTKE